MPCQCGYLMECLPEGGWFSQGRSPRENHPPEGRYSIRIPTLAWHICFIISNKPQFGKISIKTTMTASRSAGAVEKSICYNAMVTDDWWFTHSPLGITSNNGGHNADQWTWWLPTVKSANHGLRSSSKVWWLNMAWEAGYDVYCHNGQVCSGMP